MGYLDNLVEGLRTRRHKSCDGKIGHLTEEGARRAMAAVGRRGQWKKGRIPGVYRCEYCRHWHWGHKPKESK